jgi:DNA polymerase phi
MEYLWPRVGLPITPPKTPAKNPKLQNKKEKLSQVNGATPVSPVEPESKKHHQNTLSTKEAI